MKRAAILPALVLGLTSLAVPVSAHAAAPPGNGRIAYSLGAILPDPDPSASSQIYTVQADGTDIRQLTHLTPPEQAGDPNYSPDGQRLLYVSNAGTASFQVWIMRADGTHQRRLIHDPGYEAFMPRWSPDGRHLVFTRCSRTFGQLECAIATARSDGTHLYNLTGGHNVDFVAAYSPDGSSIAFSSNRTNFVSAIWRTSGHVPGPQRVTPPDLEAFWPDFSPDGSRILYTDNFERPKSHLHSIGADGGDRTLAPGCFGSYSPTGSRIVYDGGEQCDQGLTVANTDGSHPIVIVATGDLVISDWQPRP